MSANVRAPFWRGDPGRPDVACTIATIRPISRGNLAPDSMNATTCPFPYTGVNCDLTLADFYPGYLVLHYVYLSFVILVTTFTLLQAIKLFKLKEHLCPLDVQQTIFLLLSFTTLTFVVRGIDPFSWRGVLPPMALSICYDGASCALYSCFAVIVFFWISVIDQARFPGQDESCAWRAFKILFVCILWASSLSLSTSIVTDVVICFFLLSFSFSIFFSSRPIISS